MHGLDKINVKYKNYENQRNLPKINGDTLSTLNRAYVVY